MPKLKISPRKEIPRRFWIMVEKKLMDRGISKKDDQIFMTSLSRNKYYDRKNHPENLTLSEAIEIAQTLKFSEDDIFGILYGNDTRPAKSKTNILFAENFIQTLSTLAEKKA